MVLLFGFPKNQVAKDDPLNIIDVDGAAPTAEQIYGAVFIRAGQSATGGEGGTIREVNS